MKFILRVYDSPPIDEDSMFVDFGPYERDTAAKKAVDFAADVVPHENALTCVCVIPVREE